ncbi:MAG TPA: hypothetical protein VFA70_06295 [Dehalococcoidia bacterium]|nr:hypothetical protein [Dehalococcoidia bacterium]
MPRRPCLCYLLLAAGALAALRGRPRLAGAACLAAGVGGWGAAWGAWSAANGAWLDLRALGGPPPSPAVRRCLAEHAPLVAAGLLLLRSHWRCRGRGCRR